MLTPERRDAIRVTDFLLAVLAGLAIALPHNYAESFLLSWFAFIPLLWALQGKRPAQAYLLGLITGITLYLTATWWIVDFITLLKGYPLPLTLVLSLLFWLYSAQIPALLSLAYIWLKRQTGLSDLLLFPVLAAVLFAVYPALFSVQLGESQSLFTVALQGLALTGVYGLDMILVLTNAVLFQLSCGGRLKGQGAALTASTLLIAIWFGYGYFSLNTWDQRIAQWDTRKIGLVQHNTKPLNTIDDPAPGYSRSYPRHMEITAQLAQAGAELVVWPETRFIQYFAEPHVKRAFQGQVTEHGVPLLLQDMELQTTQGDTLEYNAAVLLNGEGEEQGKYRKIKRVAFGEYIPLLSDNTQVQAWFASFFGDFFDDVSPGDGPRQFNVARMNVVPLICYEVMFPGFVARALGSTRDESGGQVLITLSNNAWFGHSRQPYQHLHSSALRAIENRAPLVHVLNNGPSGVILPNGRFLFQGEFAEEAGYLVEMPFSADAGSSFYNRYPWLFIGALYSLTGLFFLLALLRRFRPIPLSTNPASSP